MPTKTRLATLLLGSSLAVLASCGDNDTRERSLAIEMPLSGVELCTREDESGTQEGFQANVVVRAVGFRQGDEVTLDIVLPADATDPPPATVTMNNMITFTATLPEGAVVLQAKSGDVQSATVGVTVNTTPPELQFLEPTPGATPERISASDDLDTQDIDIDFDVIVQTDVEDGTDLRLSATAPSGSTPVPLGPAEVTDGLATWRVPFNEPGLWTLTVDGMNACGNSGMDTVEVFVDMAPPPLCRITLTPEPITVTGVGSVLNAAIDPSADAGFQTMATVSSEAGANITIFVNDVSAGSMTAGGAGTATFALDLPEGADVEIRATCSDAGGNVLSSTPQHLLVDITPPTCSIDDPSDSQVLTPADDLDDSDSDIDYDIVVSVGGGDAEGEPVSVEVDGADLPGTITGGTATVRARQNTGDPSIPITLTAFDHARNQCTDSITIGADLAGCDVQITAPTSTVFTDADPGTAGMQVDVTVTASSECNGQVVELTGCDVAGTLRTGTLSSGTTTIRPTFCATDTCELSRLCTATVTEPGSGIVTSDDQTITVDTLPPTVTMSIISPPVVCGATITPANDFDPSTAGIQVQVRQNSVATSKWFEVTPDGGIATMFTADTNGIAVVTIAAGLNSIVAFAMDASGTGMSSPCTLRLSTLGIAITDPLNGQTLGTADGTVVGSDLSITVTGTVTDSSATVTVSVDGGTPVTATVSGNSWTATGVLVPTSSGGHTILASGSTAGGDNGQASITVFVDVSPPNPVGGLGVSQVDRRTVSVTFTEPSDAGGGPIDHCMVKSSTTAINDANFEALSGGTTVNGSAPATPRNVQIGMLRIGPSFARYWAVRCYDNAGNASTVEVTPAPFELNLELGPVLAPSVQNGSFFGVTMVAADLDDDGIDDLIASSPRLDRNGDVTIEGRVYVYMGAAGGIASSPTYIIDTATIGAHRLGQGMTRVDWNGDGVDDLAVGAPGANTRVGEVYVFYGGTSLWTAAPTTYTNTNASVTIGFAPEGTFSPVNARFGWTLAAVNFDGDANQDLAIAGATYNGSKGSVVVLFGGSSATSITVPTTLDTTANTKAYFYSFNTLGANPQYGTAMAALGLLGGSTDTMEDLAVAAAPDVVAGSPTYLFYGRAQPSSKFQELDGPTTAEEQIVPEVEVDALSAFGGNLGSIEDLNGDGKRELLISAARWGTDRGRVYVVPAGNSTGTPLVKPVATSAVAIFQGVDNGGVLGSAMANPAVAKISADIDGDGIDDILFDGFDGTAHALLVFFGATGLSGTIDSSSFADSVQIPAGWAGVTTLAWTGDLNDDNLEDISWADASLSLTAPGSAQTLY